MATHTFRGGVGIVRRGMALGTVLDVVAHGQWEKIMVYRSRFPSGIRSMARRTIIRKPGACVIRILRTGIIFLMATDTFGRRIRIVACGMALGTILNVMPLGQREKIVIDIGDVLRIPTKA